MNQCNARILKLNKQTIQRYKKNIIKTVFVSKEHAICKDLVWNVPTIIRGKFPQNHALLKSIQTKHFVGSCI